MKKVLKNKLNDKEVAVYKPSNEQLREGQKVYNKAFRESLENGGLLRERLEYYARQQNLWDDHKQAERDRLNKILSEGELALKQRAIIKNGNVQRLKKADARKIAVDMMKARAEFMSLTADLRSLETLSVQAQAQSKQFDYYVSACTLTEDGGKVFENVEDYVQKGDTPLAVEAANELAWMLHGLDKDYQKELPEGKMLLSLGAAEMVDGRLRLKNEKGQWVDSENRLLDKDGYYVNEKGERVNVDGQRVDKEGNLLVDEVYEFLDEEEITLTPSPMPA